MTSYISRSEKGVLRLHQQRTWKDLLYINITLKQLDSCLTKMWIAISFPCRPYLNINVWNRFVLYVLEETDTFRKCLHLFYGFLAPSGNLNWEQKERLDRLENSHFPPVNGKDLVHKLASHFKNTPASNSLLRTIIVYSMQNIWPTNM